MFTRFVLIHNTLDDFLRTVELSAKESSLSIVEHLELLVFVHKRSSSYQFVKLTHAPHFQHRPQIMARLTVDGTDLVNRWRMLV